LIIRFSLCSCSAAQFLYLRLLVIRKARYRQEASKSASACESRSYQLCFTCDLLVDNFRLFTGTSWIFMRPFEHHVYYTARDLQNSAQDCYLCNFLLRSVGPVSQDGLGSGPATLKVRHLLPLLTPLKRLQVKLWQDEVCGRPTLRLRLCGGDLFYSSPIVVEGAHF
jgi:hypothetical protein